ncbi:beta-lactamase family protein [Marinilongibacter aquaticus]|uniref:serine hydrolase domain-containing protein n=1 Tax=Marinilongibacter aquaticus TaxID=2975157 RepID=UPI0021BD78F2|nr:serine hydrolase domain-containing protein [Marinilongibacter aquaticus]UBM59530.1 beta-lactamase family protein [Marinilongibacter aquaticus]
MPKTILVFALLLALCLSISCQSNTSNEQSNIVKQQNRIDSLISALHEKGEFNGNILVAQHSKIVFQKELGFANGSQSTKLNAESKFNVGSIYKEIPAVAIMQLQEHEKLDIHDVLAKFLPELPEWSKKVTLLHLLQYSSGLPKISWGKHLEITDSVLMRDLQEMHTLEFEPGEQYIYSNFSPFLLSKVVEKVSGQSLSSYASTHILQVANMKNTVFKRTFPYTNREGMAIPFNTDFQEDKLPFTIKIPIFLFSSTSEDLYQYLEELHRFKLISESSLNVLGQKAEIDEEHMESALGQALFDGSKMVKHTHHGSSGNYECIISKDVQYRTTIVILTNQKHSNVHEIMEQIEHILHEKMEN